MSVESEKTDFLEEAPGKKSSMRLMCFISFLVSIPFAYLELRAGSAFPYITILYLTGAFAPKAIQKFAEKKP